MAYTATVTAKRVNMWLWMVNIEETDCGVASEAEIPLDTWGIPKGADIVRQQCELTAGTGTTIDPILECIPNADAPAVRKTVCENDGPAVAVDTQGVASYHASDLTLYHRSTPDAGADNTVTTTYYIKVPHA